MQITYHDIYAFLPEIFLSTMALIALIIGVFQRPMSEEGQDENSFGFVTKFALVAMVITAALVVIAPHGAIFDGQIERDTTVRLLQFVVVISSLVLMLISKAWLSRHGVQRFEYPVLVMFAVTGMLILIEARHFLMAYLGLELQSLALYVLAVSRRKDSLASEAGLKYFILGAVSSSLLLYGISMLYGAAGSLGYYEVGMYLAQNSGDKLALTGLVLILVATGFKVSAVPFHMWTPDVYEGAPTPVTAFFAAPPKIAAFGFIFALLAFPFGSLYKDWALIIGVLSALSMIVGSVAALTQVSLKRLMAYSSIGHMGYALIGLAAGSFESTIIYLIIYVLMNIGVFAVLISLHREGKPVEKIVNLAGYSKTHPMMAACLAVLMFSMAGIPPLFGFIGKLFIFQSALSSGQTWLLMLAILGVLTSVIGAYYYLRIIKVMYFDPCEKELDAVSDYSVVNIALVSAVLMLVLMPFSKVFFNLVSTNLTAYYQQIATVIGG